jgi:hypothetical protein
MPVSTEPILIEITLRSLKPHPFPTAIFPRPQQAIIVGKSTHPDYSFRFETGPLNEQQTNLCRLLQRHGSTVVEFSDDKRWFYSYRARWEESMIIKALDRLSTIYTANEGTNDMPTYDPEFANEVLKAAAKAFPKQLTTTELKRGLSPEPSNQALFTAIDALEADGFIEAKAMRSGLRNEIQDVAYIRATLQGRNHLSAQTKPPTPSVATVFHGDQINNFGTVGALGNSAQGVINYHESSANAAQQVDLQILAAQLERLRTEFRKTASSREDDRQLALLGEAAEAAEAGNSKGAASILSRAGSSVLNLAKDIGTDVAAKVITEMIKGS